MTREIAIEADEKGLPEHVRAGPQPDLSRFAAALAYRRGLTRIVGGMCETDFPVIPIVATTRSKAMQVALNIGMGPALRLETPLMWIDKARPGARERSPAGRARRIIVADTHTCYLGERGALRTPGT